MNSKEIFQFVYSLIAFILIDSFILILSFVGMYVTIEIFTQRDLLSWGVKLVLINFALVSVFLQVGNFLYWILDINIFDLKYWKKEEIK